MAGKSYFQRRSLRVDDSVATRAAELTLRQSIYPLILVTSLFFLWGFSYGLLDTLNRHFQVILNITPARSAGLQAAYFGAYPLASLGHAAWILRNFSYRAVFIWGLSLYGIGALLAIAAIKAKSFGGFCVCIFIIGNGLGSLETAANPYITICGPPKYAEMRINISQAFNGIGTVVAPVLGSYVFFAFSDQRALDNVQWVYLAIAVFVFILATVFYFSDIPEITDADMEFQAQESGAAVGENKTVMQRFFNLFHAFAAQFCYTGAQIAIASSFINYAHFTRADTDNALGSKLFAGAQAAFAIGRFVGSGLMKFVRPRIIFLVFITMCIVFIGPAITNGDNIGISMLYVVLFFESICFPTIVALGMRGLGKYTKRGSGLIVAGVSGGAAVPALTLAVGEHTTYGLSMVVPMMFFVVAWTYALCVNFVPAYRNIVDSSTDTNIGIEGGANDEATVRSNDSGEKAHVSTAPAS